MMARSGSGDLPPGIAALVDGGVLVQQVVSRDQCGAQSASHTFPATLLAGDDGACPAPCRAHGRSLGAGALRRPVRAPRRSPRFRRSRTRAERSPLRGIRPVRATGGRRRCLPAHPAARSQLGTRVATVGEAPQLVRRLGGRLVISVPTQQSAEEVGSLVLEAGNQLRYLRLLAGDLDQAPMTVPPVRWALSRFTCRSGWDRSRCRIPNRVTAPGVHAERTVPDVGVLALVKREC
jgi:hypothetical protein